MPIDYGRLVARTWDVVAQQRALWGLGMVATLVTGWVTAVSLGAVLLTLPTLIPWLAALGPRSAPPAGDLAALWATWGGSILTLAGVAGGVSLILSVFAAGGEAALIAAVDHVAQTGERLTFGAAWRLGRPRARQLWLLNLGIGLGIGLVVLSVLAPLGATLLRLVTDPADLAARRSLTAWGTGVGAVSLLAWPVSLALTSIRELLVRALVLERQPPIRALGAAWTLLRHNVIPVLATLLILFMVGTAQSFVLNIILVPVFLIGFAGPLAGLVGPDPTAPPVGSLAVEGCLALGLGVGLVALLGPFTAFTSALWTILYGNRRALPNSDLAPRPAIAVLPGLRGANAPPYSLIPPTPGSPPGPAFTPPAQAGPDGSPDRGK